MENSFRIFIFTPYSKSTNAKVVVSNTEQICFSSVETKKMKLKHWARFEPGSSRIKSDESSFIGSISVKPSFLCFM